MRRESLPDWSKLALIGVASISCVTEDSILRFAVELVSAFWRAESVTCRQVASTNDRARSASNPYDTLFEIPSTTSRQETVGVQSSV